jgi:Fe2+ transport system protein B
MDEEQLNIASNNIKNISDTSIDSNNQLYQINNTLIEIDNNLYSINELLNKNYEQETEKNITEKKEERKSSDQETSESVSEITIETIHEDLQANKEILQNQQNLLTVNVFAIGILIGVIVLSMFWDRYFKK